MKYFVVIVKTTNDDRDLLAFLYIINFAMCVNRQLKHLYTVV